MKHFCYDVNLCKISIPNCDREVFREKLLSIPYQLYEVEQITNGLCVAVNKPGGKKSFGRLSLNDFQVFLYNPTNKNLFLSSQMMWLPSHSDLIQWVVKCKNDKELEKKDGKKLAKFLVWALWQVNQGVEPDIVLKMLTKTNYFDDIIIFFDEAIEVDCSAEILLKLYKWIWGQEDCNYWGGESKGRLMSMKSLFDAVECDSEIEIEKFYKKHS